VYYVKLISLPRQARDKQRKAWETRSHAFSFSNPYGAPIKTLNNHHPNGYTITPAGEDKYAAFAEAMGAVRKPAGHVFTFQTKTVFTYGLFSVPKRTGFLFVLLLVCSLSRACIGKMIVLQ
jgi:hypothetical protein